ncbi:NADH-quinone oxidoreductase subunit NuoG [Acidiphilium sp. AL]|nr:NADH-quinone oxidoreductase subunit NuoG [Acidiphilium iwatense]MCU4160628.1 NADH-quinone oxidoreductase subunit NuoG [Acidiphilium sp. AL]
MAIIHIDDREFTANPKDNLLQACLSNGFDLPYFCWHPALGSVGACRQCAVRQFANPEDTTGRIVMACMTPATDGTRISIADPEAVSFRASVIEWLMTNHPHDCPVCEEGGECHLQDMTVMTGHAYRRYRFSKRTHRNQYLGPFVKHEMNRCIACYRCVRFYRDYAGGADLDVYAARNNVYFGRAEDGVLENEFSGNLVEVCPTGVFTDKTLSAAYNRKWDMRSAPSVCVHCGVGCNTSVNERGGQVRRILNRYNGAVNGYFLCDRGRFGYGFANRPDRVRTPVLRDPGGSMRTATRTEALDALTKTLGTGGKIIGIGSPRASLEANFALRRLVGADGFHAGVSAREARCLATAIEILQAGAVPTPTLREMEAADVVLVLGEDVADTAPRVALALRQAARGRSMEIADRLKIAHWQDAAVRDAAQGARSPLFVASVAATRLDDIAARTCRAAPCDIARLGFAIRHRIDANAPSVEDLPEAMQALAGEIADALLAAKRPLIVSGCGLGDEAVLRAAAGIAQALNGADRLPGIVLAVPECNSMGLALMQGGSVEDAIDTVTEGATVIVLENDLYRRAERKRVDALFDAAANVIVLDHVSTATVARADIVLPSANFAECDGTLVSGEGRAQRSFQAVFPKDDVQASWMWLRDIAGTSEWHRLDDVVRSLASAMTQFVAIGEATPPGDFRIAGSRIRSEPHRYSGRTAVDADRTVHEPRASVPEESPFSSTMEGYYGQMPASLIPFFWAPAWNSIQSLNKFQDEVGGALRGGDPGVRLFEPNGAAAPRPDATAPGQFVRGPGQWFVVPRRPIFGGEELSALAPAVAERIAAPSLALNPADARSLDVENGGMIDIDFKSGSYRLAVTVAPELPSGVAMLSVGLPGMDWCALPGWGTPRRAEPAP